MFITKPSWYCHLIFEPDLELYHAELATRLPLNIYTGHGHSEGDKHVKGVPYLA